MDAETVLTRWDDYVDRRALPYYKKNHRLMMRQVIDRFPPGKVPDLTDRDIVETVNASGDRSLKYFIGHLDRFLEIHEMGRNPR